MKTDSTNNPDDTTLWAQSGKSVSVDGEAFSVFERMAEAALMLRGYVVRKVATGTSGEGGINMTAEKTSNGFQCTMAVQCQSCDVPVGGPEVERFKADVARSGISTGLIISYCGFTPEAEEKASKYGIAIWDYNDVMMRVRRTDDLFLRGDDVSVELGVLHSEVVETDLINKGRIRLNGTMLTYLPYIVCEYALDVHATDKYGYDHRFQETGRLLVDAMRFKVFRREDTLLRSHYKHIIDEAGSRHLSNELATPTYKYSVTRSMPALDLENVKLTIRRRAGTILKRYITYSEHNSIEDREISLQIVKPKQKDVEITGIYYIYLPKWEIEHQCGEKIFVREVLAGSNIVLADPIGKCAECGEKAIAVCEKCGSPFCIDHIHKCSDCDTYLCIKHVNTCLSCGRHICDLHTDMPCNVAERYIGLLALRKFPNLNFIKVMGILFIFGAVIMILWSLNEYGGSITETILQIGFYGGPLSALTFSAILFAIVYLSLTYGRRIKTSDELIPVLNHRVK